MFLKSLTSTLFSRIFLQATESSNCTVPGYSRGFKVVSSVKRRCESCVIVPQTKARWNECLETVRISSTIHYRGSSGKTKDGWFLLHDIVNCL
ncbi:hypothetical protein Gasu2_53430 [Galdieria sulphuraria]|nr:hypothetical protein Gasu2_53430 [Galdieria sulphuraria]